MSTYTFMAFYAIGAIGGVLALWLLLGVEPNWGGVAIGIASFAYGYWVRGRRR